MYTRESSRFPNQLNCTVPCHRVKKHRTTPRVHDVLRDFLSELDRAQRVGAGKFFVSLSSFREHASRLTQIKKRKKTKTRKKILLSAVSSISSVRTGKIIIVPWYTEFRENYSKKAPLIIYAYVSTEVYIL